LGTPVLFQKSGLAFCKYFAKIPRQNSLSCFHAFYRPYSIAMVSSSASSQVQDIPPSWRGNIPLNTGIGDAIKITGLSSYFCMSSPDTFFIKKI